MSGEGDVSSELSILSAMAGRILRTLGFLLTLPRACKHSYEDFHGNRFQASGLVVIAGLDPPRSLLQSLFLMMTGFLCRISLTCAMARWGTAIDDVLFFIIICILRNWLNCVYALCDELQETTSLHSFHT